MYKLTVHLGRSIGESIPGTPPLSFLSSGSTPALGRSKFPRSCRNPFSSVHGSTLSGSSFISPQTAPDPPHLWGVDKRNRLWPGHNRPNLRDIAQLNSSSAGPFDITSEDAYLSWTARKRRQSFYYLMCALCVFPFLTPLICRGMFDSVLSWYTKGEVHTLNRRQRRNIAVLGGIISALWLCVIAVAVTLSVSHKQSWA